MAALTTIALLGAPDTGVQQFALALTRTVQASGWQTFFVVMTGDSPPLPSELSGFGLVLLMGLEPGAESPTLPAPAQTPDLAREAADQSIRAALALAAVPYRVLYGSNEARLAQALHAAESLLPLAQTETRPRQDAASKAVKNKPWVWRCDKCSDPQCEHRLLTALLDQRAGTA